MKLTLVFHQSLLERAFNAFDRLQTITLGFYNDQQRYFDDDEYLPTLAPAILDFHNKTLLPFFSKPICFGDRHRDSRGDLAVLRAAYSCQHRIKCLNLYTQSKALDFGWLHLPDEDVNVVKELLARVSTLSFPVPGTSAWGYDSPEDQPYQFLKSAINLVHLNISGNTNQKHSKEFELTVRNAYFPRLRSLGLERLIVESHELITLVQGHRATLDRLELREVRLVSQSWYDVFTAIRGWFKEFFGWFSKSRLATQRGGKCAS